MTTPPDAERLLRDGLAHHRAGRAEAAEKSYRAALDAAPDNPDALHLMGVLALQASRWDAAADWIARALAGNGDAPAYHDHLAVVRRNQGRLDDAEAGHRRALEIDPDFASAHNNLATTLRLAGRLAEACKSAERALATAPGDALIAANAGTIFLEAQSFGPAVEAFAKAVQAAPGSIDPREKLGLALFRAGRVAEAETAFRQAIELAPDAINARRWLIEVLMTLEDLGRAADEARALADICPDDAEILALGGIALWRAGDTDEAGAAFEQALALDPDCLAAISGIAVARASLGDAAGAAAGYRRVLEIDPDNVDAYGNLAIAGKDGLTVADAAHLAEMLGRGRLSNEQRATAAFALAHYLKQAGEADAAFDWYRTGNLLRRAHLAALGQVFDAARHQHFLDARRHVFTSGFFRAREGFGEASETPVFIVGLPRSGTTLVEQILAAHGQVFGAGEMRDIAVMALRDTPALAGGGKLYPDCVVDLSPADVEGLAARHLGRLAAVSGGGAARVIDKMPFNYLHLGLIRLMFPNARIIHCRRDARDTGLSCFTTNFTDTHPWTTDLADIATYINAYEGLMAHWREVFADDAMTEVRYETLITEPEAESRRLVSFLGLDWDDACLRYYDADRPVMTASRVQVRQPIYASAVGRWRQHAAELGDLLDRLPRADGAS